MLTLARDFPFARRIVNSGRLSVPAVLYGSPLNTPDVDAFAGSMRPGAPAIDAPLPGGRWLLRELGADFTLLVFGEAPTWATDVDSKLLALPAEGLAAERYDGRPGTAVLIRPDGHVCARWRRPDAARVRAAMARALGDSA